MGYSSSSLELRCMGFERLNSAPDILEAISLADPLTYGVNGLRYMLIGSAEIGFAESLGVVLAFTAAFMAIAIYLFNRIEE